MDKQIADAIWDILIEECAARENGRDDFVYHMTSPANATGRGEYRFGGELGFGGKFWWDLRPFQMPGRSALSVSCYREDETPERQAMVEKANQRLASLI